MRLLWRRICLQLHSSILAKQSHGGRPCGHVPVPTCEDKHPPWQMHHWGRSSQAAAVARPLEGRCPLLWQPRLSPRGSRGRSSSWACRWRRARRRCSLPAGPLWRSAHLARRPSRWGASLRHQRPEPQQAGSSEALLTARAPAAAVANVARASCAPSPGTATRQRFLVRSSCRPDARFTCQLSHPTLVGTPGPLVRSLGLPSDVGPRSTLRPFCLAIARSPPRRGLCRDFT